MEHQNEPMNKADVNTNFILIKNSTGLIHAHPGSTVSAICHHTVVATHGEHHRRRETMSVDGTDCGNYYQMYQ